MNPFKAIFKVFKKADVVVRHADDILMTSQVIAAMTPTAVDDLAIGIARKYTGAWSGIKTILEKFSPEELQKHVHFVFVLVGIAFGPDGMRHFSQLSDEEQKALLSRVPVLRTNHTDWPKPLQWVPRTATTWTLPESWPVLAGNTSDVKPIPDRGQWLVKRGYMAFTTEQGIHGRFGFRLDDVDGYVNFPSFTLKKV